MKVFRMSTFGNQHYKCSSRSNLALLCVFDMGQKRKAKCDSQNRVRANPGRLYVFVAVFCFVFEEHEISRGNSRERWKSRAQFAQKRRKETTLRNEKFNNFSRPLLPLRWIAELDFFFLFFGSVFCFALCALGEPSVCLCQPFASNCKTCKQNNAQDLWSLLVRCLLVQKKRNFSFLQYARSLFGAIRVVFVSFWTVLCSFLFKALRDIVENHVTWFKSFSSRRISSPSSSSTSL